MSKPYSCILHCQETKKVHSRVGSAVHSFILHIRTAKVQKFSEPAKSPAHYFLLIFVNPLHVLMSVTHAAGEPEGCNGLALVGRIHVELAAKHIDDGLAEGESED